MEAEGMSASHAPIDNLGPDCSPLEGSHCNGPTTGRHHFAASAMSAQDINLQKIRDKATKLKADLLDGFDKQLQELLDDFVQEIEKIEQPPTANGVLGSRTRKNGEPSGKEFISRRSVLSELLETDHIRTIYHIFVAILIVFMLNTLVYDFMDQGRVVLDFHLIVWTFGKFPIVMSIWMYMAFSTSLIVFPLFTHWANNRKPGRVYWVDYVWLGAYIIYQVLFLVLPVRTLHAHELPPASTVVVVTEQVTHLRQLTH
jgi:sterol O-acyltransferase